jgi:hypothetical protein
MRPTPRKRAHGFSRRFSFRAIRSSGAGEPASSRAACERLQFEIGNGSFGAG